MITFLKEIESAELDHPLTRLLSYSLSDSSQSLGELLAKVRKRVSNWSDTINHQLSAKIVYSIHVADSSDDFIDLLQTAIIARSPQRQQRSLEKLSNETDNLRVRGPHSDKAFSWPYDGAHALTAFIEYLDLQWIRILREQNSVGISLQSRCGTVVQSSCAGKSRLVEEYSSFEFGCTNIDS